MKITLLATTEIQALEFESTFAKYLNVTIHRGVFEQLSGIDCLVSPANSFGLMDGGMDAAITHYFGSSLMQKVQSQILSEYAGDQPVGTSFIIATDDARIPWLAHSPTMRVPAIIDGTDNVYRATKATLLAAKKNGEIDTIAIPAFGAGCGKVHAHKVAQQMELALRHVENPPSTIGWNFAHLRDYEIRGRI
jgi:O-acetyl-ADP-ribose deacetylase (regulator of RNase III)